MVGSGTLEDWFITYGLQVTQLDEATILVEQVMRFTLTDGAPPDAQLAVHDGYYTALHARIRQHLERTQYPPATGQECSADMIMAMGPGSESGGYGMDAEGEY